MKSGRRPKAVRGGRHGLIGDDAVLADAAVDRRAGHAKGSGGGDLASVVVQQGRDTMSSRSMDSSGGSTRRLTAQHSGGRSLGVICPTRCLASGEASGRCCRSSGRG
jgi:hypothetical protein